MFVLRCSATDLQICCRRNGNMSPYFSSHLSTFIMPKNTKDYSYSSRNSADASSAFESVPVSHAGQTYYRTVPLKATPKNVTAASSDGKKGGRTVQQAAGASTTLQRKANAHDQVGDNSSSDGLTSDANSDRNHGGMKKTWRDFLETSDTLPPLDPPDRPTILPPDFAHSDLYRPPSPTPAPQNVSNFCPQISGVYNYASFRLKQLIWMTGPSSIEMLT